MNRVTTAFGGESKPLSGIRVLDLSNLIAGPLLGMFLADFGADVIKVEHPERGDEMRNWGHKKDDVALYFKVVNRNKRLVTLDLSTAKGQDLLKRLIPTMDVVIENFRPGTLERWNLGFSELQTINPRLIMARISGYGQTGPYAPRPGFGTLGEAFSGYAYVTGEADRSPLLPAFALGDSTTAIFGAYGVLLALYQRDCQGGHGQYIDLALYEGLLTLLGPQIIDFDQLGVVQERMGSLLPFVAPRNTYQTQDGIWVALAGSTQVTFTRIAQALDIEWVTRDERFLTNQLRVENAAALDEIIQTAIVQLTFAEVEARFTQAGAPVGPVYNVRQLLDDAHIQARGNVIAVDDPDLGVIRMQAAVPRLSDTPGEVRWAAPGKGQDNEAVFGALGLEASELAALRAEHVI